MPFAELIVGRALLREAVRRSITLSLILLFVAQAVASSGVACVHIMPREDWTKGDEEKTPGLTLDALTPSETEWIAALQTKNRTFVGFMSLISAQRVRTLSGGRSGLSGGSPFDAVGKLFVNNGLGTSGHACTAFLVEDLSVIMTAAHCVYDRKKTQSFFSSVRFVRELSPSGGDAYVAVKVAMLTTFATMVAIRPHDYDYAFLKIVPEGAPAVVMPLMLGSRDATDWIAMGYPGLASDTLSVVAGHGSTGRSLVEMFGNSMTGGSSGGPWCPPGFPPAGVNFGKGVISLAAAEGNFFDSVVGPVFDARTRELYEYVKQDCACPAVPGDPCPTH
jgi:hypothetical protein